MENGNSGTSSGFMRAARALCESVLSSAQNRLDLLSIEVQEEKYRLIHVFIWVSSAVFAGVMSVTFISLLIVYLFWESARILVLGGFAFAYTLALIVIVVRFRRYLARQPMPFAATIEEIKEDRACIQRKN